MRISQLRQLFSARDIRNAALGIVVIVGGLGLSGVTLYAHQSGNVRLAAIAAGISLVFVLLILIFVVPPLARNAGREASQMNLPFEFTSGGAVMLGLILIVGFSAWNTGNNLLFLVLSFLIASVVVGFLVGGLSLKKLDVTMRFPDAIYAGEPTPILVTLNNRKRLLPAYSTVVEVRGHDRTRSLAADDLEQILPRWIASRLGRAPVIRRTLSHFVQVAARSRDETSSDHIFENRGRLLIKDFELSTKFPFGFFRHRRRLPAREAELIVFPKIIDTDAIIGEVPLEFGPRPSSKRGVGLDLLSLREYQPHDDPRRIDWKATARSQQLTVREFAAEDELRVTVFFDTRVLKVEMTIRQKIAAEQGGRSTVASPRFENGASIAASILRRLTSENAEIELIVATSASGAGTGRGHFASLLRNLALAEPTHAAEPDPDFIRILSEPTDTYQVLVTANGAAGLPAETTRRLKIIGF